jgi:hypothetical protein
MEKKVFLFYAAVTTLVSFNLFQSYVNAAIQTDYDQLSSPAYVPAIGDWTTRGYMMNGMQISVTLAKDSTVQTSLEWGTVYDTQGNPTFAGVSTGEDSTEGWRLYLENPSGSTYSTKFVFEVWGSSMDVTTLLIDALQGDTVFDVDIRFDDSGYSTKNSLDGNPFSDQYINGFGILKYPVEYRGIDILAYYGPRVALNAASPVGDLYGTLSLSFFNTDESDYVGFSNNSSLKFITDTDSVDYSPVPEPSTLLLLGIGVSALVGRRFRKTSPRK